MTVQEIRDRIAKLDRAMASGVHTIRHGETTTIYRSLDEMRAARADLLAQLAGAEGRPRRRRVGYVHQSSKGL